MEQFQEVADTITTIKKHLDRIGRALKYVGQMEGNWMIMGRHLVWHGQILGRRSCFCAA